MVLRMYPKQASALRIGEEVVRAYADENSHGFSSICRIVVDISVDTANDRNRTASKHSTKESKDIKRPPIWCDRTRQGEDGEEEECCHHHPASSESFRKWSPCQGLTKYPIR